MRVIYLMIVLILLACNQSETFNFEIQSVKPIKSTDLFGKPYYDAVVLTPESYSLSGQRHQINAGFLSAGKKGSVTLEIHLKKGELLFRSKGEESDVFVTTLAQLYEETSGVSVMQQEVYFSFDKETISGKNLLTDEIYFNLHHPLADVILVVNLPQGNIKLLEKNMGLNKQNFIQAFTQK